jgi:hypothetical protein
LVSFLCFLRLFAAIPVRLSASQATHVPWLVIPAVGRSIGENGRSFIFCQNEGAFSGIVGQGC